MVASDGKTVATKLNARFYANKNISEAKNNPEGEKIAATVDMDISNEMNELPADESADDQIVPNNSVDLDQNVNNVAVISKAGFSNRCF